MRLVNVVILIMLVLISLACGDDTSSAGGDGDVEIQESGRDRDIDADSSSNPCARFDCSPGYCKAYYDSGYCVCPEGWTFDQINMRCVEDETPDGDADKDVKDPDTDGDSEPDVDQEQPKVVKTYSHSISYDDELLEPGEIRITTGESGFASPYINYDVNEDWVVYCTGDWRIFFCSLKDMHCNLLDLTDRKMDCTYANLSGDMLIANTIIDSDTEESYEHIIMLNLVNYDITTIDSSNHVHHDLSVNGSNVVWRVGESEVHHYNILKDRTFHINAGDNRHVLSPNSSNSYVAWQVLSGSTSNYLFHILLYDIMASKTIDLNGDDEKIRYGVNTSDSWTVWIDDYYVPPIHTENCSKLQVYNIETGTIFELDPQDHEKLSPSISKSILTWMDLRHGGRYSNGQIYNPDIYLYDLSKEGESIAITTNEADQFWPRVRGHYIIYSDSRWHRGVSDIVVFDLCTLDIYKNDEMCAGGK